MDSANYLLLFDTVKAVVTVMSNRRTAHLPGDQAGALPALLGHHQEVSLVGGVVGVGGGHQHGDRVVDCVAGSTRPRCSSVNTEVFYIQ